MCTQSSTPQSACSPYRCCPLLSRFEHVNRRTCPGMSWAGPFRPQNCPFTSGFWTPHLTHGSLGPPEKTSRTASRSVQPFFQGPQSCQTDRQIDDRQTDDTTPSVAIGRMTFGNSTLVLVAWSSGITSVSGWRAFAVLRSTCSWWVTEGDHLCG